MKQDQNIHYWSLMAHSGWSGMKQGNEKWHCAYTQLLSEKYEINPPCIYDLVANIHAIRVVWVMEASESIRRSSWNSFFSMTLMDCMRWIQNQQSRCSMIISHNKSNQTPKELFLGQGGQRVPIISTSCFSLIYCSCLCIKATAPGPSWCYRAKLASSTILPVPDIHEYANDQGIECGSPRFCCIEDICILVWKNLLCMDFSA